jgi:hypothetical protein
MTPVQQELWTKIKNFELYDFYSSFTFTDRLARESGWSTEYSLEAFPSIKNSCSCSADYDDLDCIGHTCARL